jgi:hypothetical protein
LQDLAYPHREGRKGYRGESGKEDEKGEAADNLSTPIQRGVVFEGRGVLITDKKEEDYQQEPSEIVDEAYERDTQEGQAKDDLAMGTEEGVYDVSTVELSCGQEVEGGDKEPHPSSIGDRVKDDISTRRQGPQGYPLQEREEGGIPQRHTVSRKL